MFHHPIRVFSLAAALCAVMGTAACKTTSDIWNYETADRLATPANLLKRQVTADPFMITVFERVNKEGHIANIYIEGDGARIGIAPKTADEALMETAPSKTEERTASMPMGGHAAPQMTPETKTIKTTKPSSSSLNPTPAYPLSLHLAAHDLADNVIYMARPCQYSGMSADKPGTLCTADYWTDGRYSIETLNAMNTVLDKLASRYGFTGFNLIGFDGGATVAALLAAKRKDVLSLRTIGGILDTDRNEANNNRPALTGSLNPKDFAQDLAQLPQHHFLGEWDKVATPDLYQSFRNAMGPSSCIRYSTVAAVNHTDGWANRWPDLMKLPVDCTADAQ